MSRLKQGDHTTLFSRGPSATGRLLLFGVLSVVLMTVDQRYQHLEAVRSALSVAVYPLQYLVNLPVSAATRMSRRLQSRAELEEEIASLRAQHLLLEAQLQRLTVLEAENRRLRALLDSSAQIPEPVLIGELIRVETDPYRHQILIDKGSRDRVQAGQPLLDADGIVGQVIHVSPLSAQAVLITDPGHSLPVQVNRNGLRALAVGSGRFDQLQLRYLPNNADVEQGDLLVSSGLGGRFPKGYPVAQVSRVEPDPGQPFARIIAHPTAHLDRIREVLLVMREPTPDTGTTANDEAAEAAAGDPPPDTAGGRTAP